MAKLSKMLIERWNSKDHSFISGLVQSRNHDFLHSPFGGAGERQDFRGYSLVNQKILKNVKIVNVDFEYSDFSNLWIENCVFENVNFGNANLSDIKDHNNFFRNCSFDHVDMKFAGIGYKKSTYESCLFANVNFKKTVFCSTVFKKCKFLELKMKNIDFNASSFEDCMFEGVLESVWFCNGYKFPNDVREYGSYAPNSMKNVSFENARLLDVMFVGGIDLSTVIPPSETSYRLYDHWHSRLKKLNMDKVNQEHEHIEDINLFLNCYFENSKSQDFYLINVSEIEELYGVHAAKIIIASLDAYNHEANEKWANEKGTEELKN